MKDILQNTKSYYSNKINEYGPIPKGVDWKDEESQILRFEQILKILANERTFSINDLGCGYGKIVELLKSKKYNVKYTGYDLSMKMINIAKEMYKINGYEFITINHPEDIANADYTIASGIFNVKMMHTEREWLCYILNTIEIMNDKSIKGFAFNCLTKYSDKEYMRNDLFYADPCFLFDYCKRNCSNNVSVLHDYNLYEFTILVNNNY